MKKLPKTIRFTKQLWVNLDPKLGIAMDSLSFARWNAPCAGHGFAAHAAPPCRRRPVKRLQRSPVQVTSRCRIGPQKFSGKIVDNLYNYNN